MYAVERWSTPHLSGLLSLPSLGPTLVKAGKGIFATSARTIAFFLQSRGEKKHCVTLADRMLHSVSHLFFSKAALWSRYFSLAWLVMKEAEKVWGVFSTSQLARGHVCSISKMCLTPRSVQLFLLQLIRKGFTKPTVHIHSLRQCLSRFSFILSGVNALLRKSTCLVIARSFKSFLKLYSGFSI